jgi:hypothetical protein
VLWFGVVVLILIFPALTAVALVGATRLWRERARRSREARLGAEIIGPPLERIAADLRRLRLELTQLEDDVRPRPDRQLRLRVVRTSYGECLLTACRALEAPTSATDPASLPDVEIFRLEASLRERGLDVRPAAVR